ncbi:oligogalacturonate-specific porin KdgM family protein [Photobacterium sp. ZSDE20]|uniref:Oligogalacturonate-specific porin KdgM family protein n=1 Tax=Photobacterium pectinilyticum TaxID=2906793 RepID=A0ABT1N595_9GAMM|nr:oligogalacturonate-specific porin KdgM family protein [Photobacterium sp. ZSDE20]MCQ1059890.1 oligogalacturonate-specific porin KdgM family protein [Photobacterium sp. ZSDE20]MDD1826079.1 oligogalacturonate-specific porin KdgM family protein [Photobacterium sp. ZSDE20]
MKKTKIFVLALTSMIASTSVSAATLMVRQERLHDAYNPVDKNATMFKLTGSVDKTFFAVQAILKGENPNSYATSNNELQLGYRYYVNDKLLLIPKIDATAVSTGIGYKPQLGIVSNWGGGFSTEFKYKHEFFVSKNGRDSDQTKSQYQVNLNYAATENLRFGLQYDYHRRVVGGALWDNEKYKHEIEAKSYYTVAKGLTPFVTFSAVPVHPTSDDYQLRSRVGVLYSF